MRISFDIQTGETTVDPSWVDPTPPPSPPPAPASITARQLRLWLVRHGIPLTAIHKAIAELPEPERTEAEIEWEYATSFDRTSPRLRAIAKAALGVSDKEIDTALENAFREAATY